MLGVKGKVLGARQGRSRLAQAQGTQAEDRDQAGQMCAARAPTVQAGPRDELGIQLVSSGHSCTIGAVQAPAPGRHRRGSAEELRGSSASGSAQASPWQGNGQASLGASPRPTGVHRASAFAIGDALPHGAELHLLSGTRTSQGNGMVGLLSLMSITTTVSVAEPTRGGVPLSIAVTTKLWASTRA